jgi:hypothetical protein
MSPGLSYMLIQQKGFKEKFISQVESFQQTTSIELIDRYNSSVKTGIVGVYAQAVMLVALRHVIKNRYGASPVKLKDNLIVRLTGEVEIKEDKLFYLSSGKAVC